MVRKPKERNDSQQTQERDALKACYLNQVDVSKLEEAFPGVSVQNVRAGLAMLREGLVDNSETLALTRACNRLCGFSARIQFTVTEQRQAVYEWKRSENPKTKKEIENEYGISASALKRLGRIVLDKAGEEPSDDKLKEVSLALEINRPGVQPGTISSGVLLKRGWF